MPQLSRLLYLYWGKALRVKSDAPLVYHLLIYHCLDVAAVAARWWDNDPALRKLMRGNAPERQYRAWVLFFIVLHDLGKWDIRFQAKYWRVWQALNPQETAPCPCQGRWNHGLGGLYWLKQDYADPEILLSPWLSMNVHPKQAWLSWMAAVAGHHGYVMQPEDVDEGEGGELALALRLKKWGAADREARQALMQALEALILAPAGLTLNDNPPACSPLLAGFCSLADWLGSWSTQTTFCFQSAPEPLASYYQRRYDEDAAVVIARSGLIGETRPWSGVGALLREGCSARQIQTLVDKLPVRPGLTIVEAPTGSGKTEAALAYAWRLLAAGQADSIIFALPTQATANAMLERLERLAPRLFEQPNLVLAHGHSRYSQAFKAIRSRAEPAQGEEAWAQCCQWLSLSNKRAFLGQIGVCTIDQALISVLPVKHRFIRGFGLGRSILLVDEVHAYDSYMHGLLEEVLRQQYLAGQSALLLSATLPLALKGRLLATYGGDSRHELPDHYPLVSWQSADCLHCFDLTATPQYEPPPFTLNIDPRYLNLMEPDPALLNEMVAAAQSGAQVCMICNLVDVAQRVYRQLSADRDLTVRLFHSRFTQHDRAAIGRRCAAGLPAVECRS